MKYIILSFFIAIGMVFPTVVQAQSHIYESIADSVFQLQLNDKYPLTGGVISMVDKGKVLFQKGYGYADIEKKVPFDEEKTIVQIASVTKIITTTAILQLIANEKLNLEESVNKYLDDFALKNPFDQPVLVKHLLTHTSGLDDRVSKMEAQSVENILPLETYVKNYLPAVVWEPGKYFNYSNYSFVLLAYLVQEVSGLPFDKFVKQNILDPLEMDHSGFGYESEMMEDLMTRYRLRENNEGTIYNQKADPKYTHLLGVTGFKTTAMDMTNFMAMYLNQGVYKGKRILPEELISKSFETHFTYDEHMNNQQGLGWRIFYKNGVKVVYHNGDDTGVESGLYLFPLNKVGIFTAFNNSAGYDVKIALRDTFIDQFTDSIYSQNRVPITESLSKNMHGTYLYMNDGESTIDKLVYLFGDKGIDIEKTEIPGEIRYGNRTYRETKPLFFEEVDGNSQIKFSTNKNGKITHLSFGSSTYRKIGIIESPAFHFKLLIGFFVLFIINGLWMVVNLLRRWKKKTIWQEEKWSRIFISLNSLLLPLFFILLSSAISSLQIKYGIPKLLYIYFSIPLIAAISSPISFWLTIKLWFSELGVLTKLWYSIIMTGIFITLIILNVYNVIGYNFY